MRVLNVAGMNVGEGAPKVIVPVMGADAEALVAGVAEAATAGPDCIELRADYLAWICDADRDAVHAQLNDLLAQVREAAGAAPLLFTVRTKAQGGEADLAQGVYVNAVEAAIRSEKVDMVDIEFCCGRDAVCHLIDLTHRHGVVSVVSDHDFKRTPSKSAMMNTIVSMNEWGADIPKLAVMSHGREDTLRLLSMTNAVVSQRGISPVVTMAMGEHGAVSRLLGETFGSAMTFASLEAASAPGQMALAETKAALAALHVALA